MSVPLHLRPIRETELPRLLGLLIGDQSETGEFQWFGFRMARVKELERRWPEDGLIHIEKGYEGKRPRTWYTLTDTGRTAYQGYLAALNEIIGKAP